MGLNHAHPNGSLSSPVLSNRVASSYTWPLKMKLIKMKWNWKISSWLLSTWYVARAAEGLKFLIHFISINSNFNSPTWLVATMLGIIWTNFCMCGHTHGMWKFLGQGLNLCYSCGNTGSLILCATREFSWPKQFFSALSDLVQGCSPKISETEGVLLLCCSRICGKCW